MNQKTIPVVESTKSLPMICYAGHISLIVCLITPLARQVCGVIISLGFGFFFYYYCIAIIPQSLYTWIIQQ
jgi:hypothetical protein